ncbi:MAG: TraR/DksA C4-type zinc finger protein [Actinomycetota bacterium]
MSATVAPSKKAQGAKAAKKSAAKSSTAKKSTGKVTSGTKKSAAGKKAAASKSSTKASSRAAPTKAAKKPAAKKPAAKAASAKKAASKKAVSKNTTATKSAANDGAKVKNASSSPKKDSIATTEAKKIPASAKYLLDKKWLAGQRQALVEQRAKYTHSADRLAAEAAALMADREPGDVQFDEESGEGDTIAVERDRDLALSAAARQAVSEIDAALERLEANTYGICLVSGDPIPRERLEAIPEASVCVQYKTSMF